MVLEKLVEIKDTFNIDDEGFATAAAAGLDGGSINPTGASVGTKQGFSIIKADPAKALQSQFLTVLEKNLHL